MTFVKKKLVKGHNPRPDYRIAAGVHISGKAGTRTMCGYLIIHPDIMAEHDVSMGDSLCLLTGTGAHTGIIRLDFNAPKSEHNITIRKENPKSRYGFIQSVLIPSAPNQIPIQHVKFNSLKPGVIDIKLPWEVIISDD